MRFNNFNRVIKNKMGIGKFIADIKFTFTCTIISVVNNDFKIDCFDNQYIVSFPDYIVDQWRSQDSPYGEVTLTCIYKYAKLNTAYPKRYWMYFFNPTERDNQMFKSEKPNFKKVKATLKRAKLFLYYDNSANFYFYVVPRLHDDTHDAFYIERHIHFINGKRHYCRGNDCKFCDAFKINNDPSYKRISRYVVNIFLMTNMKYNDVIHPAGCVRLCEFNEKEFYDLTLRLEKYKHFDFMRLRNHAIVMKRQKGGSIILDPDIQKTKKPRIVSPEELETIDNTTYRLGEI